MVTVARALILVLILSLPAIGDGAADTAPGQGMGPGEFSSTQPPLPAPDIAVTTRDGAVVQLSDLKGRPVL